MNRLRGTLSLTWLNIQGSLFPWLTEELGPLTKKQQELVATLELIRIEECISQLKPDTFLDSMLIKIPLKLQWGLIA
jgi:hypothetical protein